MIFADGSVGSVWKPINVPAEPRNRQIESFYPIIYQRVNRKGQYRLESRKGMRLHGFGCECGCFSVTVQDMKRLLAAVRT